MRFTRTRRRTRNPEDGGEGDDEEESDDPDATKTRKPSGEGGGLEMFLKLLLKNSASKTCCKEKDALKIPDLPDTTKLTDGGSKRFEH
jgi:hypothetical protein